MKVLYKDDIKTVIRHFSTENVGITIAVGDLYENRYLKLQNVLSSDLREDYDVKAFALESFAKILMIKSAGTSNKINSRSRLCREEHRAA